MLYLRSVDHENYHCDIRTVTRNGTLLSEHRLNTRRPLCRTLSYDGSLLAVAKTSDTLYVCSPDGHLQPVSLGRPAVQSGGICTQVSTCNGLAAVCVIGEHGSEVLIVDLAQRSVLRRHDLPGCAGVYENDELDLAQSRGSLAFCHRWGRDGEREYQTTVLSITGHPVRSFVLPRAPQSILGPAW